MLLGFGESSVLSIEDDLLIGEISTSPEVGVKSDEDDPAGDVGDVCGFADTLTPLSHADGINDL